MILQGESEDCLDDSSFGIRKASTTGHSFYEGFNSIIYYYYMEVFDIRTLIVLPLLVLGLLCAVSNTYAQAGQNSGSAMASSSGMTYPAYDWLSPGYTYHYSWYPFYYYGSYPYRYYYPYYYPNYYYNQYYNYPYSYSYWYPYTYNNYWWY